MYTMLWNRAISRTQFSPLNFLRPSRVIPSWSLQPSYPLYLPFYLSSHPSFSPIPFFFPSLLSASSAKMPNETTDNPRCTPWDNFHIITVNFPKREFSEQDYSHSECKAKPNTSETIVSNYMDNVWHIFLVNCRPFVLIGNLINPKCLRKSLGFIHWTNEPKKEKKFSLFSNPIHPIKKKKKTYHIYSEKGKRKIRETNRVAD